MPQSNLLNLKQKQERVRPLQVMSADGAISIHDGIVTITKSSACAMTLTAPTYNENGKVLIIDSQTAQAHTLTITAGLRGAGTGADVGTFGGAVGDGIVIYAYNGYWFPVPGTNTNVTFA